MEIKVMGKAYPAAYTVSAQKRLAETFGGIGKEQMEKAFFAEPPPTNENIAIWGNELIRAGIAREKMICQMEGRDYEGPEKEPGAEALIQVLRPKEINGLFHDVLAVINDGNRTEVEVDEEKKTKKAEESA